MYRDGLSTQLHYQISPLLVYILSLLPFFLRTKKTPLPCSLSWACFETQQAHILERRLFDLLSAHLICV